MAKKSDGAGGTSIPRQKPKASGNPMGILLPPPPGSKAAVAPGTGFNIQLPSNNNTSNKSNTDLLVDFDSPPKQPNTTGNAASNNPNDWGLF